MSPPALLALLLCAAVAYDFVNGFHDSANIIATMIASNVMSVRGAMALAAAGSLAGPFIVGLAVAHTLGAEVVSPAGLSIAVVLAALAAATAWNLVTWGLAIPVSSSHALVGGLVGAAWTEGGWAVIQPAGLLKVAAALVFSPLAGFCAAVVAMHALLWLLRDATPRANAGLAAGQVVSATALAIGNGANDAQKTVGLIAMGLVALGFNASFTVPWWSIVLSAASLALGTAVGGARIARTLGSRFYRVRPIHGFASEAASAAVILGASVAGGPVSSTQVMSLAIVGAGAAERRSKVRWGLLMEIGVAWLVTVPASALAALPLHAAIAAWITAGSAS